MPFSQSHTCIYFERGYTHIVPVIVRKLLARVPPLDARAVDQNVHLVARADDIVGDVCDLLLDGEISREDACFAASFFHSLFCRRRCGVSLIPRKQLLVSPAATNHVGN